MYLLADTPKVFEINSTCCIVAILLVKIISILVGERDKFCLTVEFDVVEMSDGLIGK